MESVDAGARNDVGVYLLTDVSALWKQAECFLKSSRYFLHFEEAVS